MRSFRAQAIVPLERQPGSYASSPLTAHKNSLQQERPRAKPSWLSLDTGAHFFPPGPP